MAVRTGGLSIGFAAMDQCGSDDLQAANEPAQRAWP
jgi:hypothetical protein